MLPLYITYFLCGIIITGLSIPLISGKIPPNHWYGLRVHETLNNKIVWYKANKISGNYLLIYGISILLFNTILIVFKASELLYLMIISLYIFIGAVLFGIASNKIAVKLSKKIN